MRLAWLVALAPLAACGPDTATGACKDSFVSGDLVITEVFADFAAPEGGTGTDDGKEWFEIYNNSDRPVSLKGVTVVHTKIDGSDASSHIIDDVTLAPGQFFTLGNATQDLLPAYVDYGYSADLDDFFNTGGGQLALRCGDDEIDAATYDAVKSGHSRQLTNASLPDYTLNDDQANWCEANDTEFESNNFGTPGQDGDCAPVIAGACSDGGVMRDAVPPTVGDLIITEVMPNPAGTTDTTAEWIELHAVNAVDLNGIELDRAGDSSGASSVESAECLHIPAGGYAVFAKSVDTAANGNIADVKGTFSFALVDGSAATPADVQVLVGGTVLDAITWTGTSAGRSIQLDPGAYDVIANDDPLSFCAGSSIYFTNATNVSDYGTPGAANDACPVQVGPGQCLDNGVARGIRRPTLGDLVITEFLANPAGDETKQEFFEITNTGTQAFDLNELVMRGAGTTAYPIPGPTCRSVEPGGYALLARSLDSAVNGGLPAVDVAFTFSLANSPSTSSPGRIRIYEPDGTTLLDEISWPSSASAANGLSRQLNPASTNTTDNDVATSFCTSTAAQTYGDGVNAGTPKADNVCL